jgi:hypothetical protein
MLSEKTTQEHNALYDVDDVKPMLFQMTDAISSLLRSPNLKMFLPAPVLAAYFICSFASAGIFWVVAGGARSFILTLSSIVHCFGIALLCFQVLSSRTAQGISVGTLMLEGASVALRLSSTTHIEGYLPFDRTGDGVYQCVDGICLAMVLLLLWRVRVQRRGTTQVVQDTYNMWWLVLAAILLAIPLHANVDDDPIFDTLWMAGLFTGVAAQIPQLWLIAQMKGHADALTSHYILASALSVCMSFEYMYEARNEITCNEWTGFNHASYVILLAHVVHLFILADFAYFYVRALMQKGPRELSVFLWV